jgi:hypothetical protein
MGNDPDGTTWSHISSSHFDVIFPDSIRDQGEHFSRLLNRVYIPASRSLSYLPRKVPVIMHPYNLQSNGMVVWAPSRMEIITTTPSNGYGQMWLEQLAIHEYRHVVQTDMMNRGFTRVLYYLMGEQAVAFPSVLVKPWLMEGDAVATETALSYTGRGRMPSFSMGLRTISLGGLSYSYDKLLLGSLKDYVPNHYEYGYQMTAYGRYKYGEDLWSKIFAFAGNYPYTIFPLSIATKIYTGKFSKNFHKEAMYFLDSIWQRQQPQKLDKPVMLVNKNKFDFWQSVSYSYPVKLKGRYIFAQKSKLSRTPMLVKIDSNGDEEKVTVLGSVSSRFTGKSDILYWTEIRAAIRWEQQNYSELWSYDTNTESVKRLTKKTAYFSPAVNVEGVVAVVDKHVSGEQSIILLNKQHEKEQEIARFPVGQSIHELEWVSAQNLAVLHTANQGLCIAMINTRNKEFTTLLEPTYSEISGLRMSDSTLLFSSGYNGINNIYALNVQNKNIYQLSSAKYGAFDPVLDNSTHELVFSDYTTKGYKLSSLNADSLLWSKTNFDEPYQLPLAEHLSKLEHFKLDTAKLDTSTMAVKPYGKASHLFRFHSWSPFFYMSQDLIDGSANNMGVGINLLSQNNLSTLIAELGYEHSPDFNAVHASIKYTGWFPVFEVSGSYGTRYRSCYYLDGAPARQSLDLYGKINLKTYVPLRFNRGNIQNLLQPYVQLQVNNDKIAEDSYSDPHNNFSASIGLSGQTSTQMAARDIYPRWAAAITIDLQSAPLLEKYSQKISISGQVSTPGILPNNSLSLYFGYEKQQVPLLFSTKLRTPRGFSFSGGYAFPEIKSASASYTFPLWYPDLNVFGLVYIKRLRVSMFGDFLVAKPDNSAYNSNLYASFGYEALVDFHAFRFPRPMLSMGWRHSHTKKQERYRHSNPDIIPAEFLFRLNY